MNLLLCPFFRAAPREHYIVFLERVVSLARAAPWLFDAFAEAGTTFSAVATFEYRSARHPALPRAHHLFWEGEMSVSRGVWRAHGGVEDLFARPQPAVTPYARALLAAVDRAIEVVDRTTEEYRTNVVLARRLIAATFEAPPADAEERASLAAGTAPAEWPTLFGVLVPGEHFVDHHHEAREQRCAAVFRALERARRSAGAIASVAVPAPPPHTVDEYVRPLREVLVEPRPPPPSTPSRRAAKRPASTEGATVVMSPTAERPEVLRARVVSAAALQSGDTEAAPLSSSAAAVMAVHAMVLSGAPARSSEERVDDCLRAVRRMLFGGATEAMYDGAAFSLMCVDTSMTLPPVWLYTAIAAYSGASREQIDVRSRGLVPRVSAMLTTYSSNRALALLFPDATLRSAVVRAAGNLCNQAAPVDLVHTQYHRVVHEHGGVRPMRADTGEVLAEPRHLAASRSAPELYRALDGWRAYRADEPLRVYMLTLAAQRLAKVTETVALIVASEDTRVAATFSSSTNEEPAAELARLVAASDARATPATSNASPSGSPVFRFDERAAVIADYDVDWNREELFSAAAMASLMSAASTPAASMEERVVAFSARPLSTLFNLSAFAGAH